MACSAARTWFGILGASVGLLLGCGPASDGAPASNAVLVTPGVVSTIAALAAASAPPALCYGAAGLQALAPWPMTGLCPAHRAQAPVVAAQSSAQAPGFTSGVSLGGSVRGSPVIAADGTVYVGSAARFSALTASGSVKWRLFSGVDPGASPAIGGDGTVFVPMAGITSTVKALRPSTGSTKWSFSIGGTVSSGPALSADGATLYVSSQNGKLVALNAATGARRWTFTKGAMWTSPAIGADGTIYVGADDGLHAVDPATGAARWSRSFGAGGFVRSSPAIGPDGTIYVGTDLARLEATNPNGGVVWSFTAAGLGAIRSAPAIGPDGTIYFGSRDRKTYAVSPTGTLKWAFATGGNVDASAAVGADGTVYVGSDDRSLYALRPDGSRLFSFATGGAVRGAAAIGRNGTVYVGSDDQRLWAFGPGQCQSSDTTCDSRDDDCNGRIDDGFVPAHTTCGSGASSSSGQTSCSDGVVTDSCRPGGVVTLPPNATDLVGRWSFEDGSGNTARDSSGFSNHGLVGGAAWEPRGRSGACLRFDGATSMVTVPDGAWHKATPATYSLWYKSEGSPKGMLLEHQHTGDLPGSFYLAAGGVAFGGYDSLSRSFLAHNGRPAPPSVWTMATVVVTSTQVKLYKDGVLTVTAPITGGLPYRPGALFFGSRGEVPDQYFKGSIDEVSIYARALSDADVLALFQSYAPIADERPERVLELRFDEGTGSVAADSSGQHNDGAITGATWAENGARGKSLYFDGTTSLVKVPDGTWNNGTPATYSLWYKSVGSPTGMTLAHQLGSNIPGSFGLVMSRSSFVGYDLLNTDTYAYYRPAPPGVWTMATAVLTDGELKVYKNGTFAGSARISGGFPYVLGSLDIGARGVVPDNFFKGWIDELTVHRRAFSDAEVLALFQSYGPVLDDRPDMVARYDFNQGSGNELTDVSGLGNHGEIRGALWAPRGVAGGSLYFNGTDAMVTVPDGTWANGTPATYVAWYRTDGPPTGFVFSHQLGSNIPGSFALIPSRSSFVGYDDRNVDTFAAYPIVPPGSWTMIATTITDTEIRIYQNGKLIGSTPIVGGFPYTPGEFYIGARGVVPDNFFKGWIDEISIFRRALSAAEVAYLFDASRVCNGECSAICPCSAGNQCDPTQPNGYCADGLRCEIGVGEVYGRSSTTPVCWNPICDDPSSPQYECGSTSAPCGLCRPGCTPDCSGKTCGDDGCGGVCGALCAPRQEGCTSNSDCRPGYACGVRNGGRLGLAEGARACWPVECEGMGTGSCGSLDKSCGLCPTCVPSCDGKSCGSDGCNGYCGDRGGDCATGFSCTAGVCQQLAALVRKNPLPEGSNVSTAAVGTLPGRHEVTDHGDASYTIPLEVPPGVGGVQPQLALRYNSSAANGYFGVGWWLDGLSTIARCNKTIAQDGFSQAPELAFHDAFCLDGRRLKVEPNASTTDGDTLIVRYRTEEDSFLRVEATFKTVIDPGSEVSRLTGPHGFKVFGKDGRISEYGTDEAARILGNPLRSPGGEPRAPETLMWFLSSISDRSGNVMRVNYGTASAPFTGTYEGRAWAYVPHTITYGPAADPIVIRFHGSNEPEFAEPPREDPILAFRNGAFTQFTTLLRKVGVVVGGREVREYFLEYDTPSGTGLGTHSRLARVRDCDGSGTCKPPTQLGYVMAERSLVQVFPFDGMVTADKSHPQHVLDFNGDGYDDILYATFSRNSCVFGDHDFRRWSVSMSHVTVSSPTSYSVAHEPMSTGFKTTETDGCGPISTERPVTSSGAGAVIDWDNDGRQDFMELDLKHEGLPDTYTVLSFDGQAIQRFDTTIPRSKGGEQYLIDIDGDHARDLLVCDVDGDDASWRLYRNRGDGSGSLVIHGNRAGFSEEDRKAVTMDAPCIVGSVPLDRDGDGAEELLVRSSEEGVKAFFYSIRPDGSNERFATNFAPAVVGSIVKMTVVAGNWRYLGSRSYSSFARPAALLLDANGDGLTDLLNHKVVVVDGMTKASFLLALNTGEGNFAVVAKHDVTIAPQPDDKSELRAFVWDANADGLDDVVFSTAGASKRFTPWKPLYSTGIGFTTEGPALSIPAELGTEMLQPIDADGDGAHGLLGAGALVADRRGPPTDRLLSATDGLGARVGFDYRAMTDPLTYTGDPEGAPQCAFPFFCAAQRRPVVSSLFEYDRQYTDGLPPTRRYSYQYQGARTDSLGRGSLGFAVKRERQLDVTNLAPKREELTFFDNRMRREEVAVYPFAWKPERKLSTAFVDGVAFTTEEHFEYDFVRPTTATFAALLHVKTTSRYSTAANGTKDVLERLQEEITGRDDFGNVTHTIFGLNGNEQRVLEQHYAHQDEPQRITDWLIDLETRRTETYTVLNPRTVRKRTVDSRYYPNGLLEERTLQRGDPRLELVTHYDRTDHGNVRVLTATDAQGQVRRTTTDYDDLDAYPIRITNAKNQRLDVEHDRVFGHRVWQRDDNELVVQVGNDAFGRLRLNVDEAGVATTTSYGTIDADLPLTITTHTDGGQRVVEERDPRSRVVNLRTFGFKGKALLETRGYDGDGNLAGETRPTAIPASPVLHRISIYDNQRRVRHQNGVLGEHTETCYDIRTTCVRNPRGFTRCEVRDDRGRVARALDPIAASCQDALAIATSGRGTGVNYGYGPFDALATIVDQQGNLTTITTDDRGNVVRHADPDSGTKSFAYNGFGELTESQDGKAQQYRLDYDVLGRRIRRADNGGAITEWIWDGGESLETDQGELIGRLTETRSPDGVIRRYRYFAATGLASGYSDTIAGEGPFETRLVRDGFGRVGEIHYPVAPGSPEFAVTNVYDDFGHLTDVKSLGAVGGGITYWHAFSTDAQDQLTEERFGSDARTTRTYDPHGWPQTIASTAGPQGPLVQSVVITGYDGNGNPGQKLNLVRGQLQTFGYDQADRLASDTGGTGSSFSYDPIGNIHFNSAARYEEQQPHALSTDGTFSYDYDLNGNRTRKEGNGIVERTEYTRFDKPLTTWQEGRLNTVGFLYDADQVRARKQSDTTTTIYSSTYERRTPRAGGPAQNVYSVRNGARVVAQAILEDGSTEPAMNYLQVDQLGSPVVITDDAGGVTELDYDAYGLRRNPDWRITAVPPSTTGVTVTFTGHEDDAEHGLVDMGGRIYDPRIRQFTSPDPVQRVRTATQSNRYLYALGNPLRYVDPSGYYESDLFTAKDLDDADLDWYIGDLARGFDPGFAPIPPAFDPLAAGPGYSPLRFEAQNMCLASGGGPLSGTLFDLLAHGGNAGPPEPPPMPRGHQCLWVDCMWGGYNGPETSLDYHERHAEQLRTFSKSLPGPQPSLGFPVALWFAHDAGSMELGKLEDVNQLIGNLDGLSAPWNNHGEAIEIRRELEQPNTDFLQTPLSRPPHHEQPLQPYVPQRDSTMPSLRMITIELD